MTEFRCTVGGLREDQWEKIRTFRLLILWKSQTELTTLIVALMADHFRLMNAYEDSLRELNDAKANNGYVAKSRPGRY